MATQAIENPAPPRGRPPKVSPEAILDAVDRKRDRDWTMASVAAELGVSEPAIYYHFASKQALLVALGRRVLEQLPLPEPVDEWEAWLAEFAQGALAFCRSHPFLADVDMSLVAMQQTASVRVLDVLLRRLVDYGFEPEDAAFALAGVMLLVQQFALPPVVDPPRLVALAQASGATLAEGVYQADPLWDPDHGFRQMLRVVLSGIRVELAPRGRRKART
jgi:AcrR family transcriptional regulator